MKLLLQYLRPYRWLVVLALFMAAINQSFSMLDPYFFGKLFDKFLTHPHEIGYFDKDKKFIATATRTQHDYILGVLGFLGILISVAMVSRIAKAFQDYFSNVIVQKFGARIFTDGLKHSMKLPYSDFEDQRSGETLSTLSKVRTDSEKFIIAFINVLFTIIVGIVFICIYSFRLHWSIMPIYAVGIVFLSLLTSLLSKKIKIIQKNIVKETNALAGTTTESLRNIELVKSLGLSEQEINRLNNNTYKILGLELKKVKSIRALSFIQGTFVNFLRQVIMFTLLWLVFKGQLTAGEVMTLTFYSFFIFGPLQEIGNIILAYREAEASLNNFHNLMERTVEPKPSTPTHIGKFEELTFENVSFKHQTAQYKAIDNISFDVNKGETIAFVGPSGSGKSTLVKLLARLYDPTEGRILLDGYDLKEYDLTELRQHIGIIFQDFLRYQMTFSQNIAAGNIDEKANEELIRASARQSLADELAQRLPAGYHQMLGKRFSEGVELSGGEWQKVAIARAYMREAQLLILDEPTSALDARAEYQVFERFTELTRGKMAVLISHRFSTVRMADRIVVLDRGEIVEIGSHEELLAKGG